MASAHRHGGTATRGQQATLVHPAQRTAAREADARSPPAGSGLTANGQQAAVGRASTSARGREHAGARARGATGAAGAVSAPLPPVLTVLKSLLSPVPRPVLLPPSGAALIVSMAASLAHCLPRHPPALPAAAAPPLPAHIASPALSRTTGAAPVAAYTARCTARRAACRMLQAAHRTPHSAPTGGHAARDELRARLCTLAPQGGRRQGLT